jgi:hypothetical protein
MAQLIIVKMYRHTLLYQHNYITLWDIFHSIYEFNASGCYGRPSNALILLILKVITLL